MGPYRESLFGVIGIHVAAILPIIEHFELQIILVDWTPLLYPIIIADINEECYYGPFGIGPNYYIPVLTTG